MLTSQATWWSGVDLPISIVVRPATTVIIQPTIRKLFRLLYPSNEKVTAKRWHMKTHLNAFPNTFNFAVRQPKVNKGSRTEIWGKFLQREFYPMKISNLFQGKFEPIWDVYAFSFTLPRTTRIKYLQVSKIVHIGEGHTFQVNLLCYLGHV